MIFARYMLLAAVPGLMFCIIPASGGTAARFSWQIVSIWLAAVVFCAWLQSWWLRLFFAMALIQIVWHGPVITAYVDLLMIAIFMAAIQGFSRIDPAAIKNMMCLAALLLCGWMILQAAGLAGGGGLGPSASGPFNIDAGSAFIAMCLPAFWRDKWWPWAIPVTLGLVSCHATTGFLAAIAATATFAALRLKGKWRIVCGVGILIAALIFFKWIDPIAGIRSNDRWHSWQRIFQSYESAPLGRGLGSFGDIFPLLTASDAELHQTDGKKIIGPTWQHAHNEYLQTGFEMGMPAAALLIVFVGYIFSRAWLRRESLTADDAIALSGFAATAVAAAGFHIFHIAPTALLGCAWIGCVENIGRQGAHARFKEGVL